MQSVTYNVKVFVICIRKKTRITSTIHGESSKMIKKLDKCIPLKTLLNPLERKSSWKMCCPSKNRLKPTDIYR